MDQLEYVWGVSPEALSDLKNDLKDVDENIAKANEELTKLNYNPETEKKAKQMVLDRLNQ